MSTNMAPVDGKNLPLHQGNIYDPKCPFWKDPVNVMSAFKTFPCSGKSRITSSGYCDCTGYHGKKDRRRSFKYYKYFSAPCMYVKVGDEWKEPTLCPYNDGCFNCHTRFEQQFHPEVFKKMKCHDMVARGECPRGPLCAFAHQRDEHPDERSWNMKPSEFLPESYLSTPANKAPIYPQKPLAALSDEASGGLVKEKEAKVAEVSKIKYAPGNPSFATIAAGGGNKPCSSGQSLLLNLSAHFPEISSSHSPRRDKSTLKSPRACVSQTSISESVKVIEPPKYERTNSNFITIGNIKRFSSTRLAPSRSSDRDLCSSSAKASLIKFPSPELNNNKRNNNNDRVQREPSEMYLPISSTSMEDFPELPAEKEELKSDKNEKFDPFNVYEWENPIEVTFPSPTSSVDCRKRGGGTPVSQFDFTPYQQTLWVGRRSPPPIKFDPLAKVLDELIESWNPLQKAPASSTDNKLEYELFPLSSLSRNTPPPENSDNENADDFFCQMESLLRSVSPVEEENTKDTDDGFFDSYISQKWPLSEFWEKVSTPVVTPEMINKSCSNMDIPLLAYQSTVVLKGLVSRFFPPCNKFLDAWNSHVDLEHPQYPCMVCKRRTLDGARKTIFHPCEHQVACTTCYKSLEECPLCGCKIIGKTLAPDWPPRSFIVKKSPEETQDKKSENENYLKEGLS